MRTKEITYKIMSAIKSKNTRPEKLLGKAFWALGLRYRKHYTIKGKPDFVFLKNKIAVFCDGDFWHGNNWKIRGLQSLESELKGYSDFWQKKILMNIARDKKVTSFLEQEGWTVVRFWESDILKKSNKLANKILRLYRKCLV